MKTEIYLRRALLAPVIVPLLAAVPLFLRGMIIMQTGGVTEVANYVAVFLYCSAIVGAIPYGWMLYAKREGFQRMGGGLLEAALQALPLEILPYFWKSWGVLTMLLFPWWGVGGVIVLFAGTFAVPILGYVYVAVTFAFLRGFQWLGLVEATLADTENKLH